MDYFEKLIQESYENLKKMDIRELQYELNSYYLLLSTENFDNSVIMEKILFIQNLIYEKKNK
tara:strand:- start:1221 stop:1406 length:186 start_codon:yes stop_codon:yes gene_type:complete